MVTAIVGGNWGDEGKGKMTDLFADKADVVIRFQGGANAGHTIINKYGKFVLHILPSGVFHQTTVNIIGMGAAFNYDCFFKELAELKEGGVPDPDIRISDRAQFVMPYHILFDKLEERRLGKNSFGSTQSGIAPFYSDKALKIGFQVSELYGEGLKERVERVCEVKNAYIDAIYEGAEHIDAQKLYQWLLKCAKDLEPYVFDEAYFINDALKEGKSILLEGQLGALRDTSNGIYPFVTSSSTLAGFGSVGACIPPYEIKKIITVVKAYSSCVGAGPFVSEIFGDEAETLRRCGGSAGEYGATTGRPRRMGWFDAVATRYGCMLQGATDVALSIIDVLGYLDKIPVCVGYEIDGEVTDRFPTYDKLIKAKPVYEYCDGWKTDITGIKNYDELPENCRKYIEFVESKIGYPITMVSNGPDKNDIIYR